MKAFLVSFFVFLSALLGSSYAFEEWKKTEYLDYTQVVTSNKTTQLQNLTTPEGKRLVPKGALMGTNDIDTVFYTYLVDVKDGMYLDVEISNVFLTKNGIVQTDEFELIQIEIQIIELDGNQAEVGISISLRMPETEEQYQALSGSRVSFEIDFNHLERI